MYDENRAQLYAEIDRLQAEVERLREENADLRDRIDHGFDTDQWRRLDEAEHEVDRLRWYESAYRGLSESNTAYATTIERLRGELSDTVGERNLLASRCESLSNELANVAASFINESIEVQRLTEELETATGLLTVYRDQAATIQWVRDLCREIAPGVICSVEGADILAALDGES